MMGFPGFQKKKYFFLTTLVLLWLSYAAFSFLGPGLRNRISVRYEHKIAREDVPIINRYEYVYPINVQDACKTADIHVFMPVNSAVSNFYRRNLTRHSFHGKFAHENRDLVRMVFFVGLPSKQLVNASFCQKQLETEAQKYKDIVQVNVADSYRNLSLKAVGTFNWITKFCSNSKFILKLDDDVVVDPPSLLSVAYELRSQNENFVVGNIGVNQKAIREKNKKHTMTVKEFPNATYPPFIFGPAQAFPTTTAILLYKQAIRTKMIFLDDVFMTGICRLALGIPIFHNDKFKTLYLHKKIKSENFVLFN